MKVYNSIENSVKTVSYVSQIVSGLKILNRDNVNKSNLTKCDKYKYFALFYLTQPK